MSTAPAGTIVEDELDGALAKKSLAEFVKATWHLVEDPAEVPLVWNWHIDEICAALEAVTRGEITRLLINIPPGCMKSYLVSVFWPAWEWATNPGLRYLTAAYSQNLTIRDNQRVRDIITSGWYRRHYDLRLHETQNVKVKYDTTAGGQRMASSVGGAATGEHPDRIIIDDPLSADQARSDQYRETARDWFDRTISTRGAARNARIVVIMQRLHEDDLAGHLLRKGGWDHICWPMRYDPESKYDCGCHKGKPDERDLRTEAGELLWPRLFTEKIVKQLEEGLGPYGKAGQLQQKPGPEGGGLFQRGWFDIVDAAPIEATRLRGWDTASTPGGGDYTAGCRLARTDDGITYIESMVRGQWGPADVDNNIEATAKSDGVACRVREEQEGGASGVAVITARSKLLEAFDYAGSPITGDKVVRAGPFRGQCEARNVKLVRGEWNEAFLQEAATFPVGMHDDQIDAASCAYNELLKIKHKASGAALW